jgi:menaquinone-dependent protoporphyrinogen oxidase
MWQEAPNSMKPILVIYATREGHTRHIAEHLGAALSAHQRSFDLVDAADIADSQEEFSITRYCAAIVSASLHFGRHEPEIVDFVKSHLGELQQIPTVFLSVSLSEQTVEDPESPPEERAEARATVKRTLENFLAQTGWRPMHVAAVAGALMYSKYNFVVRFIMKRLAKKTGAPVDTTQDYEFTDWAKLDHLIED